MDTSLRGKRALVCGSTQGIGKASSMQIASLGADVTLMARNEASLRAVVAELPNEGQDHNFIVADFKDPDSVKAAVMGVAGGGGTVHVLVNNTGGPKGGPILDADPQEFIDAISMHVVCGQILVQALVPGMKDAGYGRIINIISTSVKAPIPGIGVSNATRGAVASWAKTLAGELAPFGITVNNVLPGFTDTARLTELFKAKAKRIGSTVDAVREAAIAGIPAGRLARPEEVGAAVAFLATPAASYINGINVPVDGGRTQSL